jgi:hypothetical protein
MIDKRLVESRRCVGDCLDHHSFSDYTASFKGVRAPKSADRGFLSQVLALCLNHGAAAEGWTDYQLLRIAGFGGANIMAASAWMFHHLLADANLLESVRLEGSELVLKQNGSVDLAQMTDKCPLRVATWYETLRFYEFTLGRYVHEDTALGSRYLIRKGSYILAPLRPHHYDESLWGPDVESFAPKSFLMPMEAFMRCRGESCECIDYLARCALGDILLFIWPWC